MRVLGRVHPALWWLAPALLVIEAVNANRPGLMWIQWTTTVDVVNGAYILLAPLCAGVSCALSVPLATRWQMVNTLPDSGLRALALPTLSTAGVFAAVHTLALVISTVVGKAQGMTGWPNPAPAIAVFAAFLAAAAVGTLIGRLSASLIAAPFCVLLLYGYEVFEPKTGNRLFSDFGGATVLLLGLVQRLDVILWQTVWLVAVSAIAVSVAIWGRRIARGPVVAAALIAVVVGSGVALNTFPETRFTETAVTWVCDGTAPEVCVVEEYEDDLDSYSSRVSDYAHQLERLGAPFPATFRQAVGSGHSEAGAFSITDERSDAPLVSQVVQSLYPCSQTEWGNRELDASDVVVAYLVEGDGGVLYPGQRPASRRAATQALSEIAC